MVFPVGKELFFGCVRKGQMAEVMKECRKPNDLSPGHKRFRIRKDLNRTVSVPFMSDDVEDAASELHDAERMLEPPMCRSWIDEVRQRKLVNVPKPLERP
jgi:hypothetical protein